MMQRNASLDLLRVVAAFVVIWLHAAAAVVVAYPDVPANIWWAGNIADAFSRWCVPIFVMVSGALLLSTPCELAPLAFYRKRAARLLPPLVCWTFFYILLDAATSKQFDPQSVAMSIVVGMPYFHLWYLYMIVGLYLATPFLRQIVVASSPGTLRLFVIGTLVLASVESIDARGTTFLSLFIPYIGYFVAGYYFTHFPILIKQRTLLFVALCCGGLVAIGTGALLSSLGTKSWDITYSYLDPLVIVMSLCVFIFFLKAKLDSGKVVLLAQRIAPITLGIYLIHPFWLKVLNKVGINGFFVHPFVGIPTTALLAFALSAVTAALFAATPVLKRTVL